MRHLSIAAVALALLVPGCGDNDRTTNVTVTDLSKPPVLLFAAQSVVNFVPGNANAEGSNLVRTFESLGRRVGLLYDLDPASFALRIQGRSILAIPDQALATFDTALTGAPGSRGVVVEFVQGGGIFMVFRPDTGLDCINNTFFFSLASGGLSLPIALEPGFAGTIFDGAPATLPNNNAVSTVDDATLPAGSIVVYADANGDAAVVLIPFGQGWIALFGWDWFDAAPVGSQDGGWLDVLDRTCKLP